MYRRRFKKKKHARRPRRRAAYKAKAPLALRSWGSFRYSSQLTAQVTLGTLYTHVFSANGMYDPDITLTGHQPRGFDQMMTLYDHYVVTASTLKITAINQGTEGVIVGITPVDVTTARSSLLEYLEDRKSKWMTLGAASGGVSNKTLTYMINIGSFLGRKPFAEDDLKGSASANPLDGVFFHVWIANLYGVADTNVAFAPLLDYKACCIEPKQPPVS